MLNKTRKLITGTALSLSAAVLLLLFTVTESMAAALAVNDAGTTTIANSDDTVDASNTAAQGHASRNLVFDEAAGSGAQTPELTITGAGTVNFGTFTMTVSDDSGDRAAIIVGNGNGDTVVIFNGAVTGVAGANSVAADLDLTIDGSAGTAGAATVKLYGTTDAIGISMTGDADGVGTLEIGDGTTGVASAALIDMSNEASSTTVLTLKAASTQSGAIELSSSGGATAVTINMEAGSSITGAVNDAAAVAAFTLNVNGSATLGAVLDVDATGTSTIAIDDAAILDMSSTGKIDVDAINLTGTAEMDFGANVATVTGVINGVSSASGILDLDADVTFSSDIGQTISLATIEIGGVTTFSEEVKATSIVYDADVVATYTKDSDGAITTTVDGAGTYTTAAALAHTGQIGTSLLKLKLVNHAVGNSTFNGTIYADSVSIAGTTTLTMGADDDIISPLNFAADGLMILTDGADITGNITNTSDSNGTITVNGASTITGLMGVVGGQDVKLVAVTGTTGILTLTDNTNIINTTIAAAGQVKFVDTTNNAITTEGNFAVTGAGIIDVGTVTVTGSGTGAYTCGSGCIFKVTIGTTNGKLDMNTGGVVMDNATVVTPVIAGTVTSGVAISIIEDTDTSNKPLTAALVDNYARYDFTLAVDGNDVTLTPTVVTPTGVGSLGGAVNAVADVAFASDTALADALNGLSGAAADKALVSLAPSVDGGAIVGAVSAGAASGATVSTQMASLRSGIAAGQGLNAGDRTATQERFWTQGFGTYAEQGIRQKIAGFTSTTGGAAFGVDSRLMDDLVLGLAYSFSHTNVNGSESKNVTKVQSHQATLYGSHDFDRGIFQADGVFLDGQLSYAYNDYDGERNINVGAVSRRADSEYDGMQISTKFDLGRIIELDEGFRFTPTAGVSYSHVSIDSYNETNAGDSNLKLQDQDYDILNFNLKGKIATTFQVDGLDVTPEVHLGYTYEMIHDKIQTLSTFEGGGNAFTSTGFSTANNTYLGGIGVTWGGDSLPVDVTLTYDAAHKEDFLSHSALVKGVWRF